MHRSIGPDELRPAMEAGRVAVIAQRLAHAAWQTQVMLSKTLAIAETPSFSEDTLSVLTEGGLVVVSTAAKERRTSAERLILLSDFGKAIFAHSRKARWQV